MPVTKPRRAPTLTSGLAMPRPGSIWMRSGLKSPPAVSVLPKLGSPPLISRSPRAFRPVAFEPPLATVSISPKRLVGPTTSGSSTVTNMPSRLS